jgi:hypothetical protein
VHASTVRREAVQPSVILQLLDSTLQYVEPLITDDATKSAMIGFKAGGGTVTAVRGADNLVVKTGNSFESIYQVSKLFLGNRPYRCSCRSRATPCVHMMMVMWAAASVRSFATTILPQEIYNQLAAAALWDAPVDDGCYDMWNGGGGEGCGWSALTTRSEVRGIYYYIC